MAFPRATGHPDYSSTGLIRFIPAIWSGKLIEKFYDATVLAAISNTDYEGEIKSQGDTVIIRTTPTVTINDYVKGQKLVYERLESTPIELLINRGNSFSFVIDKVDKYQSDIDLLSDWARDASEQMKIAIDRRVLGSIFVDVHPRNRGTTAGVRTSSFNLGALTAAIPITKANILDFIVDCGTILDEQNVPETGRWFVVPPWFTGMIKKSDLKDASLTGDGSSVLRNGRIGMIDRFTIYASNNVSSAVDTGAICFQTLFGTKAATSFAAQMTEVETLKAESTFGDLVRGLNVYGFRVIQPEAMGVLYCRKA